MAKVEIRDSIKSDFDKVDGGKLPWRTRAFSVVRGNEVLGIGGLLFMPDGTVAAFVRMPESSRHYKVAIHKAGLRAMQEARRLGIKRIVALADPDIAKAEKWLHRLGFRLVNEDGNEVWLWQTL